MVTHIHAKAFAGTRGWGGGGGLGYFKKWFRISTYLNVNQNFISLKHLISKTDFTAIKHSGQGSFKVKKRTIDKLLFFTENHRHLPIACVNDPLLS